MVNTQARWLYSALCQGRHGDCKGWLLPRTSQGRVSMVILSCILLSNFLSLGSGTNRVSFLAKVSPEDAILTRRAASVRSVSKCRHPPTPQSPPAHPRKHRG